MLFGLLIDSRVPVTVSRFPGGKGPMKPVPVQQDIRFLDVKETWREIAWRLGCDPRVIIKKCGWMEDCSLSKGYPSPVARVINLNSVSRVMLCFRLENGGDVGLPTYVMMTIECRLNN